MKGKPRANQGQINSITFPMYTGFIFLQGQIKGKSRANEGQTPLYNILTVGNVSCLL